LRSRQSSPGLAEVIAAWGLLGLDAAAIYRLYAGSLEAPGLLRRRTARGAGIDQLLVYGRHPGLPVAVGLVPIAVGRVAPGDRLPVVLGSALAGGVTSVGMARLQVDGSRISRDDVLAGAGITAALGATIGSAWKAGIGPVHGVGDGDAARVIAAAGLIANGLPWLLADLGIYAGDLPGLGRIVLSRQLVPEGATWPAVHLGHHHGLDGTLLGLAAVVLSRVLPEVRPVAMREGLSLYLAVLLVYGAMRAIEDGWNEQVVKRGWSRRKVPLIVRRRRPVRPTVWAGMLGGAAAIHAVWFRRR
jgi:hypothetical protein